jgi:hypothetical protein
MTKYCEAKREMTKTRLRQQWKRKGLMKLEKKQRLMTTVQMMKVRMLKKLSNQSAMKRRNQRKESEPKKNEDTCFKMEEWERGVSFFEVEEEEEEEEEEEDDKNEDDGDDVNF